ncbi:MAG: TolC family protein, partial [Bacteroidota bacterium]|nr:TolC family protein [Bacteroidota bacterium]
MKKIIDIHTIKRKPNINRCLSASCILLILLMLGSCKVGQQYERPQFDDVSEEFYVKDSVLNDSLAEAAITRDSLMMSHIPWREFIEDSTLIALIDTALVNNIDLQKAMRNMDIGMEYLAQSKANFLPSVNATPAGFRREYYSENYNNYGSNRARRNHGETPPTSLYTERLEYTSALQADWEIDIWGKLRWQKEAARADFMKSQEFKKAVQTELIAEVASTYYNLIML